MRGDNRHHNHRGAVAGNAADAVLIDDNGRIPGERGTGVSHCESEVEEFVGRQETGASDEEGCDFHVGVSVTDDVLNDRLDLVTAQRFATDLGPHIFEALRTARGRDEDRISLREPHAAESGLRETDLVRPNHRVVMTDIEARDDGAAVVLHLQTLERLESFGPERRAVRGEHGHIFPQRVERNTAYLQPHILATFTRGRWFRRA